MTARLILKHYADVLLDGMTEQKKNSQIYIQDLKLWPIFVWEKENTGHALPF